MSRRSLSCLTRSLSKINADLQATFGMSHYQLITKQKIYYKSTIVHASLVITYLLLKGGGGQRGGERESMKDYLGRAP